jgi:hypothetical protein
MTDLEKRLADWGLSEAAAAGSPPAFRRAPARRWLPAAAAAAVLLVVLGAAAVLGSSGGGSHPVVAPTSTATPSPTPSPSPSLPPADVPWAALEPGPLVTQSPLPRVTADPNVRRCRVSDLRAEDSGVGDGAGGTILRTWQFRNIGATSCLLTGRLDSASGVRQGNRETIVLHQPGDRADVVPVVLAPGDAGIAPFSFYPRCDDSTSPPVASTTFTDIQLGLLGGFLSVHSAPDGLNLGCHVSEGLNAGAVGGSVPALRFADQPLGHLRFRIDAPSTVQAGHDLDYVLTVSNPTGAAIALRPCPSYLQWSGGVKDHFMLNCAQARPVPARGQETFAMRLHVPSDADTGSTKLAWGLDAVFEGRAPVTAVADVVVTGGSDPRVGHVSCTPSVEEPPCTTMELGQAYAYLLETHCGLRSLYADGRYWVLHPAEPHTSRAPSGYDDPQDAGKLTLMKPTYLEYRSRQGSTSVWSPGAAPATRCQ